MKENKGLHGSIVTLVMLYLFIPLVATFLYSIATDWYRTILPEGYTLAWYKELFTDPRFLAAMQRTLLVCFIAICISVTVMVPTIFIVTVYFSRWELILQSLVMLPYAIPGVVAAVGLIKVYSSGPIVLSGSIWLLVGAYFVVVLPYMYQGIRNSMRTIDAIRLVEAAELLGASRMQAFWKVIFPNILTGIVISTLLSFSTLFGEFVLANLLVGGHYETMQIYLIRRMEESGHLTSAIVVTYFILLFVLSGAVMRLGKSSKEGSR
ncbi:ABC transporter permease [Brevibacillus choshinensis]|uniref:ABC transporter permease n=1 Tax=Brevibacillus choshinensis TaxID=54911 RepID=A0ABR5N5L0_BRECH|nr:ABC transporter permease [Brevibacillus choshinensis]KQL45921.1 ABC transporter permease [Brevibacillus choshinensis]